jgi:hypothetical protein
MLPITISSLSQGETYNVVVTPGNTINGYNAAGSYSTVITLSGAKGAATSLPTPLISVSTSNNVLPTTVNGYTISNVNGTVNLYNDSVRGPVMDFLQASTTDSYLQVYNGSNQFPFPATYTESAWIWVPYDSSNVTTDIRGVFGSPNKLHQFFIGQSNNALYKIDTVSYKSSGMNFLHNDGNTWVHVCATFSNAIAPAKGKIDFYYNGKKTLYDNITGWTGGDGLLLGSTGTDRFVGLLSDMKVYDQVLTEEEVERLYKAELKVPGYNISFGSGIPTTVNNAQIVQVLSPSVFTDAQKGSVLNLQSGYLSIPSYPLPATYTKAAWIKRTQSNVETHIISSSSSSSPSSAHYFYIDTNNVLVAGHNGYYAKAVNNVIPLNVWTHVSVTYDYINDRISMYVNGDMVVDVINFGLWSSNAGVQIGAIAGINRFTGYIKDVSLFDGALPPLQVETMYNS